MNWNILRNNLAKNSKQKYWALLLKNLEGRHTCKPTESYLKLYFNIMYYLLFIPFKIKTNKESGEYVLVSNRFQKICCGFIYLFAMAATFTYFLSNSSVYFNPRSNIYQLISTVGCLSGNVMAIVSAKVVWFQQPGILRFLSSSKVHVSSAKVNALVIVVTVSVYGLQLAFSVVRGTILNESINKTMYWITEYIDEEQENHFLRQVMNTGTNFIKIILIQGCAMYIMPRLLLIFIFIQLKHLGHQFEKFVECEAIWKRWAPVKRVVEEYDQLRKTVNFVNSWIGETLLAGYVCVLTMLENLPGSFRDEHDTTVGLAYTLVYTGMIGVAMVIGSDLPMSSKWITMKRLQAGISQSEMSLLLAFSNDVDCGEPIGLSCPFFTVTYSFVGSMIGVLTTYGVTVFQMHG